MIASSSVFVRSEATYFAMLGRRDLKNQSKKMQSLRFTVNKLRLLRHSWIFSVIWVAVSWRHDRRIETPSSYLTGNFKYLRKVVARDKVGMGCSGFWLSCWLAAYRRGPTDCGRYSSCCGGPEQLTVCWLTAYCILLHCFLYADCGRPGKAAYCGRKGVAAYVILNMRGLAADCLLTERGIVADCLLALGGPSLHPSQSYRNRNVGEPSLHPSQYLCGVKGGVARW